LSPHGRPAVRPAGDIHPSGPMPAISSAMLEPSATPAVARRLRAAGRGLLVLLAAALPFELVRALAKVGPLEISSVELFLYAALTLWGLVVLAGQLGRGAPSLSDALGRWRARARGQAAALGDPHVAVAAWAAVLIASAALAPADRAAAMKF